LQAAMREHSVAGGTTEVEMLRSKLNAPIEQELKAMLGADGMAAYSDYESTSAYRVGFIEPIRPALASANATLSAEQEEQLVRIIIANVHSYRAQPTDLGTQGRFDWDAIQAQANAVLTPAQAAVFQSYLNRWKTSVK
jgi:hypothetical protein